MLLKLSSARKGNLFCIGESSRCVKSVRNTGGRLCIKGQATGQERTIWGDAPGLNLFLRPLVVSLTSGQPTRFKAPSRDRGE